MSKKHDRDASRSVSSRSGSHPAPSKRTSPSTMGEPNALSGTGSRRRGGNSSASPRGATVMYPPAEDRSPVGGLPTDLQVAARALEHPWDQALRIEERPWLVSGEEIGRGGMGRVESAEDRRLRREVAIKGLLATTDPRARAQFVTEAQITAQLEHPHIPPVHDLCLGPHGELSFTMKLVRGRTLSRVLEASPPTTRSESQLEELLTVFAKICDAVAFAHSRGVLHRDIKPDNVMVGSHGQVYLMDWGCALLVPGVVPPDAPPVALGRYAAFANVDNDNLVVGTPNYMAPEQAYGFTSRIDERTDVYLLGGLLYCILTGQPPRPPQEGRDAYRAAQLNIIRDPASLPVPVLPPPALMQIAMRAMSTRPDDRFPNVTTLKSAIVEAQQQGWWFSTLRVPAGTIILREGEEADAAFIIQSGICEVFRERDGEFESLRRMEPGEVFGETAIITSRPRAASVRAVSDASLTVVTRDALERAIAARSWVGAMVRTLAGRFDELVRVRPK